MKFLTEFLLPKPYNIVETNQMKSATLYATMISPHLLPTDVIRVAAGGGGGQRQLRGGAESDGHGELSEGRTGEREREMAGVRKK